MTTKNVGFGPGGYLLVLPRKVRNVCSVVLLAYADHGELACGVITRVRKIKLKFLSSTLTELQKKGWAVLENKDAGRYERYYMSIMTHNPLQFGHVSLQSGANFKDREDFFKHMESYLSLIVRVSNGDMSGCTYITDSVI